MSAARLSDLVIERTVTLAPERLARVVARLVDDSDAALALAVRKAVIAAAEAVSVTYTSPNGNVAAKPSSRTRREVAARNALVDLLADWPGHPLGQTRHGVYLQLNDALGELS
jgi:hypothetical protein